MILLLLFIILLLSILLYFYTLKRNYKLNYLSNNSKGITTIDSKNDYIKKIENDSCSASEEFKSTNKLILKKAHVPLKTCFKIAFKNIWKKKIRFLVIIIITSISLAFLSFSIELNGEKLRQNVYTMIENGYRYTTIEKLSPLEDENDFYSKYNSVPLPNNSYNTLKSEMNELTLHKYEVINFNYAGKNIENANFFYTGIIKNVILFDPSNDYILLEGRLPEPGTQEILVTDYLIANFEYFNLFPNCNNYYDYINEYIDLAVFNDYKIVGIIDTPYEKWSKFMKETEIDETFKDNYSFITDFEIMSSIVVNEFYFNMEKTNIPNSMKFNTNGSKGYNWNLKTSSETIEKNQINATMADLELESIDGGFVLGRYPTKENEIVIPSIWAESLFDWSMDRRWWAYYDLVDGNSITLSIISKEDNKTYEKTFTIVGITTNTLAVQMFSTDFINLYSHFKIVTENIIFELPTSASKAYQYFNEAYNKGYVINVWKYRADIDSYTVDPFVDIISKAGLFVFIIFTMGIMWTIMTIEIVDSKKEIGILRSIGLSGSKVSLIFIIQTLFVNLCAYLLGIYISSKIIPLYNGTIRDELNLITLYMYSFTYRTPLYLFIFIIVMSLLTTLVPLYKITSQKIIDVINERE